jgi:hypothetical protein
MVKYVPIDNKNEDAIQELFLSVDHVLQFEESQEPREPGELDHDVDNDD